MAIIAESVEPAAEQGRCISTAGRHQVTISSWDYRDYGDVQDVIFQMADDEGRRQGLRFGLSDPELSSGELTRFLATALQRQLPEPEGIPPHIVRQMLFNTLVGRRVLLVVEATSRGVQIVVDREAVVEKCPRA